MGAEDVSGSTNAKTMSQEEFDEYVGEKVDERLRTDASDEIRAIARDAADEVIADKMVDSHERTRNRWSKMSSKQRAARLGAAFAGQTLAQRGAKPKSDNLFLRTVPFVLQVQRREGRFTWNQVAEQAGSKGLCNKKKIVDEEVADVLKTAVTAGDISSAGALIPQQMADDVIEFLYSTTILRQMGARTVQIEGRSIDFGKQGSTATHYWVGEGYTADESAPDFGQVRLELKESAIIVAMTNQALNAVPAGLEQLIEDDMVTVAELGEDIAGIRASGNAHVPTGIKHQITDDNSFASSGNDTADIVHDFARMMYLVAGKDVPMLEPGWILSERTFRYLLQLRDANDNQVSFAEMVAEGQLFGEEIFATSNIPTYLGDGADETEAYFGDASQLLIGEGTDMQLENFSSGTVGDKNLITDNMQAARLVRGVDFRLRHPEAFAEMNEVTFDASFDGH